METYKGIFIPNHKVIDRDSKAIAEETLYNWNPGEFTAEEWILETRHRTNHSAIRV